MVGGVVDRQALSGSAPSGFIKTLWRLISRTAPPGRIELYLRFMVGAPTVLVRTTISHVRYWQPAAVALRSQIHRLKTLQMC
jgi:hypothetical protein